MKRSSAILLWISLLGSLGASVFQVLDAITAYRTLHLIEIDPYSDFASHIVVHISTTSIIEFLPIVAWLFVRVADRPALNSWLGRCATWSVLAYLLLMIGTILWIGRTVTR
jgi:hypothetical protein